MYMKIRSGTQSRRSFSGGDLGPPALVPRRVPAPPVVVEGAVAADVVPGTSLCRPLDASVHSRDYQPFDQCVLSIRKRWEAMVTRDLRATGRLGGSDCDAPLGRDPRPRGRGSRSSGARRARSPHRGSLGDAVLRNANRSANLQMFA